MSEDRFFQEAARDAAVQQLRAAWYRERVANIHAHVTAYDVLRHNGISLKQNSDNRPEQIPCPFHGKDAHPSAKIHPATGGDDHSHVYCFVCKEKPWDAIALWHKFSGAEKPFSRILTEIEKAFGIEAPKQPEVMGDIRAPKVDVKREEFDRRRDAAEARLLDVRDLFREIDDLRGYLILGQVLDKIVFQVENNKMDPERGSACINQVLEKIRQKASSRVYHVPGSKDLSA